MTEHVFPWPHKIIYVLAWAKQDDTDRKGIIGLRCRVAEHGAMFEIGAGMLSIHEGGLSHMRGVLMTTGGRRCARIT